METHDAYTRLLGLALRGGNLVIGSDAVQSAAFAGTVRLLMLSADASPLSFSSTTEISGAVPSDEYA